MASTTLDYIVSTPAGTPTPTIAIAGSRAGAIGVLNLEFAQDHGAVLAALDGLQKHGRGRLGVLLSGRDEELLTEILAQAGPTLGTIVLAPVVYDHRDIERLVRAIHQTRRQVYLVVKSVPEAKAGEAAGVDAFIAKGHEAGGWVGEETAFVLLQRLLAQFELPIWVQGGISLNTARACWAAGAAGVVLDSQLLLTRETPLPKGVQARVSRMDGSETACFGATFGAPFRAFARPDLPIVNELHRLELDLSLKNQPQSALHGAWRAGVNERVDWQRAETSLLGIGQDAAFADRLARRFGTVGGVLSAFRQSIDEYRAQASQTDPLAEGAPLAGSHGTRYPIVQGPMTRVSDRAEFAAAVAEAGALPFLALALMRAPDVRVLLEQTRQLLGSRPWGVGILGFVPSELRAEQLEVIREYRPPFALIAGGRPDQARALEQNGISTYLHVPSPGLLEMFVHEGARRFVFEGRECGGHVGPRTSFVLWESMVDVLLDHLDGSVDGSHYHVLFAGGIHDGLSATMAAAVAAPLIERGIRFGVLMGTAYVFTEEAVEAGAIGRGFQQAALDCAQTVLLESGPGHATRCAPSPFVGDFQEEKRTLLQSGLSSEEIRNRLEGLNVGRLRVAAKGIDRHPDFGRDPNAPRFVHVSDEDQWTQGMYMIGQVAALRDRVRSMAKLHEEVSNGQGRRPVAVAVTSHHEPSPEPAAIAIVGMSAIVPGAGDLRTLWSNMLNKVDSISEVPPDRWDWRQYYDPDPATRDKIYSRWGGFIDDIPFDPLTFGMPPNSLRSIEPFQLITLVAVRDALRDAGYLDRPFPRERTSVVLGAGGGGGDLSGGYVFRSSLPAFFGFDESAQLLNHLDDTLPQWTEDTFPGLLMNVAAGRVANRFDLGGMNYTIDAACASSLAAVYQAVTDLEMHRSDVAIVGGIDTLQSPFIYLCFAKTHALSPSGRCHTFDAEADGIAISEGFAILILKRLDDAERDGDRIYAVIRGVGSSSDGRDRGLTAPRPEGQVRALRRAYAHAGFSPATVELIEAHGTGTVAGDKAEVESLTAFFSAEGARHQSTAIGSIKSMIGHTKATAGVAGLVKTALALHHRVLPPTLGVTRPNPRANFPESPFYINSESRPWLQGPGEHPRRAGVSAFGFGGTNFHAVLEEYTGNFLDDQEAVLDPWPCEVLIWRRKSRRDILDSVATLLEKLEQGARPRLADLAYTLALENGAPEPGTRTLAVVAESIDDLQAKLHNAVELLSNDVARQHSPHGIHFAEEPLQSAGDIAFLFPGQGSQTVNMTRDLAILFPLMRSCFEQADRVLADQLEQPLSRYVFPPPAFTPDEQRQQQAALTSTDIAQPALAATEMALVGVLRALGLEPQMVAGHSFGEFVALWTAGSLSDDDLLRVSEARGRFMKEGASGDAGTMAAVEADVATLQSLLSGIDVTFANLNAPQQTVISGATESIERAISRCDENGVRARRLPVACAFHSPLVAPAQQRLAKLLSEIQIQPPRVPVFSNSTAATYPDDATEIAEILSDHLVRPVDFVREITAMYESGARIFVEVGPRTVLTGLVSRILGDQFHLCVPLDQPGRPGLVQLLHGLAALIAEGVPLRVERLFSGRSANRIDLKKLDSTTGQVRHSPTTWLVNGGRARPAGEPRGDARSISLPLRIGPPSNGPESSAATTAPDAAPHQSHPRPAAASRRPADIESARTPRSDDRAHATAALPAQPQLGAQATPHAREGRLPVAEPQSRITPAPPVNSNGEVAHVMHQFQNVMQHFLDTQRNVMLTYLQGGAAAPPRHYGPIEPGAVIREPIRHAVRPPVHSPPPRLGPGDGVPAMMEQTPAQPDQQVPAGGQREQRAITQNGAETDVADAVKDAVPEPSPTVATASEAPPSWDRDRITEQLLEIVSERTGYPKEMVGLEVDLEAELGIDSIKRVEIIGMVVRSLDLSTSEPPDMERLTSGRSLREIIEQLEEFVAPQATPSSDERSPAGLHAESSPRPFDDQSVDSTIGRLGVRVVDSPPVEQFGGLCRDGVIVVTDDLNGVSERLIAILRARGHQVIRIASPGATRDGDDDLIEVVNMSDPAAVTQLVARMHEHYGPAKAIVHLATLQAGFDSVGLDPQSWHARLAVDLQGLFLLSQALQADLEVAARHGGAAVLAATPLGGSFGSEPSEGIIFPGHGGVSGYLKSLARELTDVRVKVVDVAPDRCDQVAESLYSELLADDGVIEVGYRGRQRVVVETFPAPLVPRDAEPPLNSESVVLITGGARGITAEAAVRIADMYQPTLILAGRTPLSREAEPPETAGLTEPAELKRALVAQLTKFGQTVSPATVERAYRQLVQQREVRENLARIEQCGSTVHYVSCDVRDAQAFGALIDQIYETHGRIDGVIHGAGIIEDKLIRDKKLDSFERVIRTKIDGAIVLARKLRPDSLRFFVFFSSVSGRFGNRGQADYAAASEILNKLALDLDRRWPGHIVSINWGPWLTTGMVSPEVKRQFAERGVTLIPVETGCQRLLEELRYGSKGEVEVVIGGFGQARHGEIAFPAAPIVSQRTDAVEPTRPDRALPLLASRSFESMEVADGLEILFPLNIELDPYFLDHQIKGQYVFPFTMAMELMAEVASLHSPGYEIAELRHQRLLSGVAFAGEGTTVKVTATALRPSTADRTESGAQSVLKLAIQSIGEPSRVHYQAQIVLSKTLDAQLQTLPEPSPLVGAGPFPMDIPEAYRTWLFSGPTFQGIHSIEALGETGARAILHTSTPHACLGRNTPGQWIIDPVLLDCALQVHLLWGRRHWDMTSLPSEVYRYRRIAPAARHMVSPEQTNGESPVRLELRIRPETSIPSSHADYFLYSLDGQLLSIVEDVWVTGNRALNAFMGWGKSQA
jgi:acyl transferase domain-containing protein/NAD(P)H-dependent flavin oxidoreductase YrpB (nitropropane dioxygenase family)/NAD(P)-dependent dehydrogenase (short-subunit alcohol dehydrogenase family)/acyl carrier protein